MSAEKDNLSDLALSVFLDLNFIRLCSGNFWRFCLYQVMFVSVTQFHILGLVSGHPPIMRDHFHHHKGDNSIWDRLCVLSPVFVLEKPQQFQTFSFGRKHQIKGLENGKDVDRSMESPLQYPSTKSFLRTLQCTALVDEPINQCIEDDDTEWWWWWIISQNSGDICSDILVSVCFRQDEILCQVTLALLRPLIVSQNYFKLSEITLLN